MLWRNIVKGGNVMMRWLYCSGPCADLLRCMLQLAPWKLCRRELLSYLESLLDAAVAGAPLAAPPQRTDTMWSEFVTCLKAQDLLSAATPDIPTRWPFTPAAVTGPLLLILDDNFYYQSMRYEIYQLARRCEGPFPSLPGTGGLG